MENNWLEKLVAKLDDRLDNLNIAMTEIKSDLKEHMRRSLANEVANELLQKKVDSETSLIEKRLVSLEKVKDRFHFLGWLIIAAVGVVESIDKLGLFK